MKHFFLLTAFVVAVCSAQSYTAEPPSQIIGVPGPRWNGPLSPHIPGQLVGDTPEVAAAKAAHYRAHADVLAVLPPLPPQERYQMNGIPLNHNIPAQQPTYINNPSYIPNQPIHTSPQFMQFAEEIPRSEIGEVPEVDAARKAHLAAYEEIKKILPKLETMNARVVNPVVPQQYNHQWNYNPQQPFVPQDTADVAAAKLEHMRLFNAALG